MTGLPAGGDRQCVRSMTYGIVAVGDEVADVDSTPIG
jgi:hypothetical protein